MLLIETTQLRLSRDWAMRTTYLQHRHWMLLNYQGSRSILAGSLSIQIDNSKFACMHHVGRPYINQELHLQLENLPKYAPAWKPTED